MTLKDLLSKCADRGLALNVTALAYFKKDKSYYSFRTISNKDCELVLVKDYKDYFDEDDLMLEVRCWDVEQGVLWIDIVEWID